jgi:hypothetical protein
MYQKNYHFRTFLVLCMILLLSNHQLFGYENSIELERGKSKNNFAFTSLGQIKYRDVTIRTLKGTQSLNIRSVSVSVSNSGTYAFIMLNDYNYGGIEWMIFNTVTKKISTEKPSSLQNITFSKDVIWSDYTTHRNEKYLIIPQAGESQRTYFCVDLDSGKLSRIEIDNSDLSPCQLPMLTNNHHWLTQDMVSVIVSVRVNIWADKEINCNKDTVHLPRMVTLNLKNMSCSTRK